MADNTVRADTPDPTKYFPNRGGIPGTMIPRAGRDGESLGFDHNRPQVVVVDPGENGGGFTLDIAELSKHRKAFNAAAVQSSVVNDVSSFYRELSQRQSLTVAEPMRDMPVEPLKPLENLPSIPAAPVAVDPEVERMMEEQIRKAAELKAQHFAMQSVPPLQSTINALIERVNALSAIPVPEVVPQAAPTSIADAFVTLQIPFLAGEKPLRPEYETYFEMPRMGTMAARYHAVVPGQSCLALVYDTRFVDGFQYLPPNLGEEFLMVSVPKLKATFRCSSMGLHWSLGCLDVVILLLHAEDEA